MKKQIGVVALIALVLIGAVVAVTVRSNSANRNFTRALPVETRASRPAGGLVKVSVSTPPEMADTGEGGAVLRSLVLPRLFEAQPNGTWAPSLVQPGSDGSTKDAMTAWFTLRPGVQWSNGLAISVADLRRTADVRFVATLDDPTPDGRITVHLKYAMPDWRRLWSVDGITGPSSNVTAGPFSVSAVESGEKTTLVRNATWFRPAFLDSLELDYVPDPVTARQLLANSVTDVVQPTGDTVRSSRFAAMNGVKISSTDTGGRWVAFRFNSVTPSEIDAHALSAFPRSVFVQSLLAGEATPMNGFLADDDVWSNFGGATGQDLKAFNATLTTATEESLADLLGTTWQRAVAGQGGKLQVRNTDGGIARQLFANKTFDVGLVSGVTDPKPCWTCLFGDVDPDLAHKADGGDKSAAKSLEQRVRDSGVFAPLWRERTVAAYRTSSVNGVIVNGYNASVAWNAEDWWKPSS